MIPIITGIANTGGLGGGPTKILILIVMLNYSMNESTTNIYPFIMGGTLGNNLINLFKRHPLNKNRPLIDFNFSMMVLPNVLFGSSVGVLLNSVVPAFPLSIMLILMVAIGSVGTIKKAK